MRSARALGAALAAVSVVLLPFASGDAAPEAPLLFEDVTKAAGLRFHFRTDLKRGRMLATMGAGVAMADYDGDGSLDLFFTGSLANGEKPGGGPCSVLYRNRGDGTFEDVTNRSGIHACGWTMGAHWVDFDSDGRPDLFVTGLGQTTLWHNLGGTFEEVSREKGLDAPGFAIGLAAGDVNGDGRADIYVVNYLDTDYAREKKFPTFQLRLPDDYPGQDALLFVQREDGGFEECTAHAGLANHDGRGMTAVFFDFDGDGDSDLYVANDRASNALYRNRGDGTFEDVTLETGAGQREEKQARAGMGVAIGDVDGDGFPDLLVTNYGGEPNSLYRNVGGVLFEDASRSSGIAAASEPQVQWGTDFADLDDDSWPDLIAVSGALVPRAVSLVGSMFSKRDFAFYQRGDRSFRQPPLVWRNLGGGTFREVSATAGDLAGLRLSARGLAAGDLDGDGRIDLAIAAISGGVRILRNDTHHPGSHALEVLPVAGGDGRTVLGTKVVVTAGGRRQVQEFFVRPSYASGAWAPLHFGLGASAVVEKLEVIPPGRTEPGFVFHDVPADHLYRLRDGRLEELRSFRGRGAPASSSAR